MALKKYRIVRAEGIGRIELQGIYYDLKALTDGQAETLFTAGSRYIEKIPEAEPDPMLTSSTGPQRRSKEPKVKVNLK